MKDTNHLAELGLEMRMKRREVKRRKMKIRLRWKLRIKKRMNMKVKKRMMATPFKLILHL